MKRILIVFCSLLSITVFAQHTHNKHQLIDCELEALEFFNNLEYANAVKKYQEYESLGGQLSTDMNFKVGVSCLEIYHYKDALKYLKKCEGLNGELTMSYHYYYAKALQLNGDVLRAKVEYQVYLEYIEGNEGLNHFIPEIKKEIASCEVAKEMMSSPVNVDVKLLPAEINTVYDEHSPLLSANEQHIYFTSDRPFTTGNHFDKLDGTYFEDIYVSNLIDGNWSSPVKVETLDSKHHDACVALSHDGHQMIIYRYTHTDMFHRASGKLYLSMLENGVWSKPKLLPISISAKAREVSACFSIDDKEIYFVSDREGGYGGTDIYRTKKLSNGEWSDPINLGETVNTPFDEDAPYVHPDGKILYFSSCGHQTMGGFDIFKSNITGDHIFSSPENIGYPINTTGDDISFSISSDGKEIYFADNRVGGVGDMDIYTAEFYEPTDDLYVLKGKVLSQENKMPLDVLIKVHITGKSEVLSVYSSDSLNGDFVIMLNEGEKYTLEIEKEGYSHFSEEIDTNDLAGFNEVMKDIILESKN